MISIEDNKLVNIPQVLDKFSTLDIDCITLAIEYEEGMKVSLP